MLDMSRNSTHVVFKLSNQSVSNNLIGRTVFVFGFGVDFKLDILLTRGKTLLYTHMTNYLKWLTYGNGCPFYRLICFEEKSIFRRESRFYQFIEHVKGLPLDIELHLN